MKKLIAFIALCLVTATYAADLKLENYNWYLTDIASKNYSKEVLYQRMDTDFVRTRGSICSNRALMWAHDFKRKYNLDTAKIFLFYTKKKSRLSEKTWWYHVSPIVNENGTLWVMDAGFPGWIDSPLLINDWTNQFVNSSNCKEISANETDLIELMFAGQVFPHRTRYGWNDCYYVITPHTIWTPDSVAKSLLGYDSNGKPVNFVRNNIDSEEYYQACVEATTSKLGYVFGGNKNKCRKIADNLGWMNY
jgi:hypothetical protein